MAYDNSGPLLSVDDIFRLATDTLEAAGLAAPHAGAVARAIAAAERDGCTAHGLNRLPGCVMTIRSGKLSLDAEPVIDDVSPSLLRIDAGSAYSLRAFEVGSPLLAAKARATGIAAMAINNCFHFTALWPEVERLAGEGLAALAMTPSHGWVAPAGGREGLLGTNPIAFAWPRPNGHPYVFDFATSAMARSEIALRETRGEALPPSIGLDPEGRPTTDPRAVLDGAMLTFGGHKGSALATMIELMAGPLIGDLTSRDSMAFDAGAKAAPHHGELVLAFDPGLMGGGDLATATARAERLFDGFAAQGARLPSERRYAARARSLAEGIRVPKALYDRIAALRP